MFLQQMQSGQPSTLSYSRCLSFCCIEGFIPWSGRGCRGASLPSLSRDRRECLPLSRLTCRHYRMRSACAGSGWRFVCSGGCSPAVQSVATSPLIWRSAAQPPDEAASPSAESACAPWLNILPKRQESDQRMVAENRWRPWLDTR